MSNAQRATAFQESQSRIVRLARDHDLSVTVPATPDWTAHDLVCHMIGVGLEHVAGTATDGHPPEWTAKTVADRRDRPLDDVLQEWLDATPAIVDLLREGGEPGVLIDLAIHEQDLRGALGEPGFRDSSSAEAVQQMVVDMLGEAAVDAPGLRLVAGGHDVVLGSGEPAGTLTVDPFELARAAVGRRSADQVRAWPWPSDPQPWLALLPLMGEHRDTDLPE